MFIHNVTALIETIREKWRQTLQKQIYYSCKEFMRLRSTTRPVSGTASRATQHAANAKKNHDPNMKQDPIKVIVTID